MKNLKKYALAATIAVVAGFGIYLNQPKEQMSETMLENIEAIASGEGTPGVVSCSYHENSECHVYSGSTLIATYYQRKRD
ncbi:MAG: NVEALA domain-containing protein [Mediterranea sp.]|nr:NVEALA domain-containing protein [Mediterranea sp.]